MYYNHILDYIMQNKTVKNCWIIDINLLNQSLINHANTHTHKNILVIESWIELSLVLTVTAIQVQHVYLVFSFICKREREREKEKE